MLHRQADEAALAVETIAAAGSDREVVLTPTDLEVEELVLRDHADGSRGGG